MQQAATLVGIPQLARHDRIAVVHGLLLGTNLTATLAAVVAVGHLLMRCCEAALRPAGHGLAALDAVAALALILALLLGERRTGHRTLAEIKTAAAGRAISHAPIRLTVPAAVTRALPQRLHLLVSVAERLLFARMTVQRLMRDVALIALVLPGACIVGSPRLASAHDYMLLSLIILGTALVVRSQLMAVGQCLLQVDADEKVLNSVLFPG